MFGRRILLLSISLFALSVCAAAADVTGKWIAKYETPRGVRESTYDLKADGDRLTGKVITSRGESEIQDGKINGDEISFVRVLTMQDREVKMLHKGKVSGDEIHFTVNAGDRTMEFVAKKEQ